MKTRFKKALIKGFPENHLTEEEHTRLFEHFTEHETQYRDWVESILSDFTVTDFYISSVKSITTKEAVICIRGQGSIDVQAAASISPHTRVRAIEEDILELTTFIPTDLNRILKKE